MRLGRCWQQIGRDAPVNSNRSLYNRRSQVLHIICKSSAKKPFRMEPKIVIRTSSEAGGTHNMLVAEESRRDDHSPASGGTSAAQCDIDDVLPEPFLAIKAFEVLKLAQLNRWLRAILARAC